MTPTSPMHGRRAVATPSIPHDPIQLHAQAENALSMALYYLRQPASNMPGAARKTVQALAALSRLNAGACNARTATTGAA